MERMHLALVSLNQTALDLEGNLERIVSALTEAQERGADFTLLPELSLSGYGCEDAFFDRGFIADCWQALESLRKRCSHQAFAVGLPVLHRDKLWNGIALVAEGRILAIKAKTLLAGDGIYYEPRWFQAWTPGKHELLNGIPFGDFIFGFDDCKLAFEVCEEAWTAEPFLNDHATKPNLVLNPSASHFALGKHTQRRELVTRRSKRLSCVYAYANLNGLDAGRAIYDGGSMVAVDGKILLEEARFHFRDFQVSLSPITLPGSTNVVQGDRSYLPFPISIKRKKKPESTTTPSQNAVNSSDPFEEFAFAEMLGLWDYLRKSGAKGYTVSLSGGCDSSVCALLVAHMFRQVENTLGRARLAQQMGLAPDAERETILKAGLLCMYQGTRNSSQATRSAARGLSEKLGANYFEVELDAAVEFYQAQAVPLLGRELDWGKDDLPMQNIQARARAPMIWLYANLSQHLLIATGNRSEAATGYFTADGDSAGGLSPLAGVSKAFLLEWLRWAATDNRHGIGPVAELQAVLAMRPSAELRPVPQTDEADLMPYEVLAEIERGFIEKRLGGPELKSFLAELFLERFRKEQLDAWVERFLRLWSTTQWKRDKLAPGFHIDFGSTDSRSFLRYPILSRRSQATP